jgi:hypothetical protein
MFDGPAPAMIGLARGEGMGDKGRVYEKDWGARMCRQTVTR